MHDFKIVNGIVIPVFTPCGNVGIVWLGGPHFDLRPTLWPFAQIVGAYAFERIRLLSNRRQQPRAHLSDREREVLLWVAKGKSAWEIGQILNIASRTVETHIFSVVNKLGAGNRTHAVAIAMRDKLIEI